MSRLAALTAVEARLLVRDWTVLVFAFVFPPFVMLILAGVFGNQPDEGYAGQRPDDYYVTASLGVPVIALALVGLPVALASYRELGVLRRFEAFGTRRRRRSRRRPSSRAGWCSPAPCSCSRWPRRRTASRTWCTRVQTLLGLAAGTATLVLLGIAIGLAAPTARAAQAIGLLAFFPLYLLGGGGPPKGVMTDAMQTIADALPSAVPAISEPWLGTDDVGSQLPVLAVWAAAALLATVLLARRRRD